MACETYARPQQTLAERKEEVRKTVGAIGKLLAAGLVKAKVGKNGAITFENIDSEKRNGVTDACIYRRIMATGTALEKMAIAKAEQLAGCTVDRAVVGQGVHSHDGGNTWHRGH